MPVFCAPLALRKRSLTGALVASCKFFSSSLSSKTQVRTLSVIENGSRTIRWCERPPSHRNAPPVGELQLSCESIFITIVFIKETWLLENTCGLGQTFAVSWTDQVDLFGFGMPPRYQ